MSALLPVYERDIVLVRGKGARLFDKEGRAYLDFAAGIGVNGLGYGDRKVVEGHPRAGRQAHPREQPLPHRARQRRWPSASSALAFPSKVFFCNSGTEAWEGAMKFARRIGRRAGRIEFVCFERAFHGRTMGALSTTWTAKYREPFEPLVPGVRFCPWNDLAAVGAAIGPTKTAAVMIEPVQGEGGVRPAPPEFLQRPRGASAASAGALLVFDEVQCGLGRTGRMFAYQHAGVTPDILTLAKPLGGGLPMGAILLREDLAAALTWATTAARSAATRWPRPPPWPCSTASPPPASSEGVERRRARSSPRGLRQARASAPERHRRGARPRAS